ncbi:MAG: radical SAM protein [Kiritimatiellae bacterium]|nr:radical SAM protein [Kiritimatiellia bacterium]
MTGRLCELCPHRCGADRFSGAEAGFCGALDKPRVFRWGPHFGEEPPITLERGSGCVFFSRCTMKCLYCQNSPWSWKGAGEDKSVEELAAIFRSLVLDDKIENINLVSPTPYLPFIREAANIIRKEGIKIPYVWNSSGYERVEVLEEYRELCDWALFDLRYSRDETARRLSSAPGYVDAARAAVKWAYEKSGVDLIVRILVLPGHHEEAIENLAFLATELSNEIPVSVMSQFTPAYKALETPPLNRSITEEEYEEVVEAAADFGFENGWIQGYEASDPKLALLGENMTENHGVVK